MLVADDQATSREATGRLLRESGYRVILATDGQDAIDRVAADHPDLLIMDVVMPRVSGVEACRALRKVSGEEFLPILLLSSRADPASKVEGLRAGADDYLGKPCDSEELRARVEALLRIRRVVDDALRARSASDELAQVDRLTGLHNHRYLGERLEEEFQRAERYDEPLSLLAVDIDELDAVNNRHGRAVGDRLLEAIGRTLRRICRQVDVVTRAEADEFVVILPNTHFAGSVVLAERVWREARATVVEDGEKRVSCDVSVGVACYPNKDVASARDLLRFTHAALARAKAEGQGKICLYQHQGYLFQPR